MTIDRIIKRQMKAKGWDKKRLSHQFEAYGLSNDTRRIDEWTSGMKTPSLQNAVILSKILEFSLDEVSLTNE